MPLDYHLTSNLSFVSGGEDSRKLQNLATRFWRWKLRQFPEYATIIGFHEYDPRLESYAWQTFDERKVIIGFFIEHKGHSDYSLGYL